MPAWSDGAVCSRTRSPTALRLTDHRGTPHSSCLGCSARSFPNSSRQECTSAGRIETVRNPGRASREVGLLSWRPATQARRPRAHSHRAAPGVHSSRPWSGRLPDVVDFGGGCCRPHQARTGCRYSRFSPRYATRASCSNLSNSSSSRSPLSVRNFLATATSFQLTRSSS